MGQVSIEQFITKIFKETDFFKADLIKISPRNDRLEVSILKSSKVLKTMFLKTERREEIAKFFNTSNGKIGPYSYECVAAGGGWELNRIALESAREPSMPMPASTGQKRAISDMPVVLLLEDDPDQAEIVELMLEGMDCQVKVAPNGEEALLIITELTPDLIISDLMMPKMDGMQFVKHIKSVPELRSIPILVLTVIADPEKEYALLNLGVDDYCQKTVPRKVLIKRIENLIARTRQAAT